MGFKNKQVGNERMEILGHAQMFTPNTGAPKGLVFTTLIIVVVSFVNMYLLEFGGFCLLY